MHVQSTVVGGTESFSASAIGPSGKPKMPINETIPIPTSLLGSTITSTVLLIWHDLDNLVLPKLVTGLQPMKSMRIPEDNAEELDSLLRVCFSSTAIRPSICYGDTTCPPTHLHRPPQFHKHHCFKQSPTQKHSYTIPAEHSLHFSSVYPPHTPISERSLRVS